MKVILHKETGSTKAIQHLVSNYHARGYESSFTTSSEIYIGSMFPFNNLFISLDDTAVNGDTSTMVIEYWDGSQFRTAPHIQDETEVGGVTLAESGFISFTPDYLYPWQRQDAKNVSDIQDQVYYDLYWMRITFTSALTEDVKIKFIGNVFCTDNELYGEFYKFSTLDFKDAWGEDKVDWLEQRIIASDLIIGELKTIGKLNDAGQILDRLSLKDACVQMVAHIVYMNSGINYKDESDAAYKEANRRLKLGTVKIDQDNNAVYNNKDVKRIVSWSR